MDQILGQVTDTKKLENLINLRNDDDFADRLSHRITPIMFIAFAIMVSVKQFTGEDKINCWVPAHFTDNHLEYTNSYCWIRNTYYLPDEEYIPKEHEDRHVITYYQWVPLILLVMALLYHLPIMLWRSMNQRSGIDVNSVVETSEEFAKARTSEEREDVLEKMTKMMDRYLPSRKKDLTPSNNEDISNMDNLESTRNIKLTPAEEPAKESDTKQQYTISYKNLFCSMCYPCCGRSHGNYMCALYIFVKLLFLANILFQFFALNFLLGHKYSIYGFDVFRAIANGEEWEASEKFPRVTLCDLKIRRLGNVQRYSVQCLLPINLFNEKIFLLIWFWMVFVAVVTILSLIQWTMRSVFSLDKYRFVNKHLSLMDNMNKRKIIRHPSELQSKMKIVKKGDMHDKSKIRSFVDEYLQPDGVFVLRLVGANTNAITLTSFVNEVWDYKNDRELFNKRRENRKIVEEHKKKEEEANSEDKEEEEEANSGDKEKEEEANSEIIPKAASEPHNVPMWGTGRCYIENHHV